MSELMRLAEQSKNGPEVIDAAYITSFVAQEKVEYGVVEHGEGNGKG